MPSHDDSASATIRPPSPVVEIAERLERAGFETWCVGGAVRDALLGHAHLDWDLATAATPAEVQELFGPRRTIPVGAEFGTVGVLDRTGRLHEVTTFRRDVRTDGRHAEVQFGVSLEDDLERRDFTINAIAYHPIRRILHDPLGGQADLERRVIRAVGDPDARMREDRLRALRALRFAGRLGFDIEPATWQAIVGSAPHLGRLSAERVKQEIEKTLDQVARPSQALRRWRDSGAFETLIPALRIVSDDTLAAIDCLPHGEGANDELRARWRRLLRLAALFSERSQSECVEILSALRFSKQDGAMVSLMVERWRAIDGPMREALLRSSPADGEVRRWVAHIGRLEVRSVMRLASARWKIDRERGAPAPSARAVHSLYRRLLRSAFRDPVELRDLAVDGDDLRRAGIPAGPGLGKILNLLLERVVEDPSRNQPDWLLTEAARLHVLGTGA
jgi:tRNA nucleotidyltransferase (CCA-adding enzyme)